MHISRSTRIRQSQERRACVLAVRRRTGQEAIAQALPRVGRGVDPDTAGGQSSSAAYVASETATSGTESWMALLLPFLTGSAASPLDLRPPPSLVVERRGDDSEWTNWSLKAARDHRGDGEPSCQDRRTNHRLTSERKWGHRPPGGGSGNNAATIHRGDRRSLLAARSSPLADCLRPRCRASFRGGATLPGLRNKCTASILSMQGDA